MTSSGRWRLVGAALAFGAAYDLGFGVAILVCKRPLAALLRLEIPPDPVYLNLNGVFLLILASIYAAASRQPERYRAVAPIAGVGRLLGFALFAAAWAGGGRDAFFLLGLTDLAVGVATLHFWRRAVVLSD